MEPQGTIPSDAQIIRQKVAAISGNDHVEKVLFEDGTSLDTNGLFVAYGVAGSSDFARKLGIAMQNNKIIVDQAMATNLPGLFAAGDCVGGIYQIAKAVNDGSVAGMSASRYVRKLSVIK
ncbi:Ferredoxin--NADP reductase [bioreactor metagenome]|uniref:Ferredoxin--NADP reductase n=1 Tax=bioreactor metagenome TaxID=1076179 RepID=A0A645DL12_9ZZZZ